MDSVYVKLNERHLKVQLDEILFIEAAGSYLKLVTMKGEFSLPQNLSQFMRKNPIPNMLRIHRSYVVNLTCVESFDNQYVYVGLTRIPISNSHRGEFMTHIHCL
jgi:two-component system LytT family response regulator